MSNSILTTTLHLLLLLFVLTASIHGQVTPDSPSDTDVSATGTPSSSPTQTEASYPICATGGGQWSMDPPTAIRLSELFCDDLYMPGNFPLPGLSFHSPHYPTDLTPEADSANYTAIEESGIIANMWFGRSASFALDNGTFIELGTAEQCARDNCTNGMRDAVRSCQYNSHYVGGDTMFMSDCGVYILAVWNCSGNWVDVVCDRWHVLHPDVGLSKNETAPTVTYSYHGDDDTTATSISTSTETNLETETEVDIPLLTTSGSYNL